VIAAVHAEIDGGVRDRVVEEEECRHELAARLQHAMRLAEVVARGVGIEMREHRRREREVVGRVSVWEPVLRRRHAAAVVV
jgi:hypothetical protein